MSTSYARWGRGMLVHIYLILSELVVRPQALLCHLSATREGGYHARKRQARYLLYFLALGGAKEQRLTRHAHGVRQDADDGLHLLLEPLVEQTICLAVTRSRAR